MTLIYVELVDIAIEAGIRIGKVRAAGALKKVPLDLLTNPRCGDRVQHPGFVMTKTCVGGMRVVDMLSG